MVNILPGIAILGNKEKASIFFLIIIASGIWLIYLTFYNSRFLGWFCSKICSKIYNKDGNHLSFDSFSINILGGKLMFRNLRYANTDYSVTINDGYVIFRWWLPHPIEPPSQDGEINSRVDFNLNKARVSIYLSGCDVNWFYKANVYEPLNEQLSRDTKIFNWLWDLVPCFDIKVLYGRAIIGNSSLPYSLTCHLAESYFLYKKPNSKYRQAVEGKAHSFEVNFIPTQDYTGDCKDPPYPNTGVHPRHSTFNDTQKKQYADNNVVNVCFSRKASVNYYWDLLPNQVEEEEVRNCSSTPEWGVSVLLANNSTINWGPWCDRQRERIWKFYNPIVFEEWSYPLEQMAVLVKFDLGFSSKLDSKQKRKKQDVKKLNKVNIEFVDEKRSRKCVQLQIAEGSSVETIVPYTPENGVFTMKTNVMLKHVQCTLDSEPLSHFINAKHVEINLDAISPKFFNNHQLWKFNISVSEASVLFVWPVKNFLTDFINDWSREKPLDLYTYIPVTYEFIILGENIEVFVPVNEYNYIDCRNPLPIEPNSPCRNSLIGVVAPKLNVEFALPFDVFAPSSVETVFNISTYQGSICVFIPQHSPSHDVQKAEFASQESYDRAKTLRGMRSEIFVLEPEKWREVSSRENGWVDVASFNSLAFNFEYKWYYTYRPYNFKSGSTKGIKFDPLLSEPDFLKVGIKASDVEAIVYPTLIPCVLNLKENILGYWDEYVPFAKTENNSESVNMEVGFDEVLWKPSFRPFSVIVDVEVSNIVGRLPFPPNLKLPNGGPGIKVNNIWFELDKHYQETRMQLIISDLDLTFDHIHSGVKFSGLQYRGFAFFSAEGEVRIDMPLEYAWMQDIEIGKISGEAPLDFLANLNLWIDQVVIVLDDYCNKFYPPRVLVLGDEMKYEKIQVKWLGANLLISAQKSKGKICIGETEIQKNNLKNDQREGFLEARLGEIYLSLGIYYNNVWLQGGVVKIPSVTTSIEDGFSDKEFEEQQAFLYRHDKRTHRLKFLWDDDKSVRDNVSLKSDWGCAWFEPTASYSSDSSAQRKLKKVKRGGSLLRPSEIFLDIEKQYRVNQKFATRRPTTSITTEDALSINARHLDTNSISAHGSLNSARLSVTESPNLSSIKGLTPSISRQSTRSKSSAVGFNIQSKSTASSMTDIQYHSAVSSVGSTTTLDYFSCDDDTVSRNSINVNRVDNPTVTTGASGQLALPLDILVYLDTSVNHDVSVEVNSQPSLQVEETQRLLFEERSRNASSDSVSRKRNSVKRNNSRKRQRPSNLPLNKICSPDTGSPEELFEPYDEFLVTADKDLNDISGGITNSIVVSNPKSRLVSFDASEKKNEVECSRVLINMASREDTSAIDIFLTPLSLMAMDDAIEEVQDVCEKLHYSTIATILLGKVIQEIYMKEATATDKVATKKQAFQIKIDQVKIGLLQSSTNHEAVFNNYDYSRSIPCLTYLIAWFDSTDLAGETDQYKDIIGIDGHLRRFHMQLRANTVKAYADQLDGTNIVHLQETESRQPRQISVGFKTIDDWGYIMAEAGLEGIGLCCKKKEVSAECKMDIDKIWTLAAAPSSLSKQRQWSLLSTASSGVKSWIERTEELNSRIKQLRETIVGQRCKAVTAPLAHHLAMENFDENSGVPVEIRRTVQDIIEHMNDTVDLPLTQEARELRKSMALSAAVAVVKLLADANFISYVFRDGSEKAEYFLPNNRGSVLDLGECDHIPSVQTLKKGLIKICADWQMVGEQRKNEGSEDLLKNVRMPMPVNPSQADMIPLLGDLEMGNIGMAKTLNNSYSLPRGGVASVIELKPILDYCCVQIINVPETFSSLFKKGIEVVDVSIKLSKIQVFIQESRNIVKNQFILQRINQPALGLDQIKMDAKILIPQSDENRIPTVTMNVDINELCQRLDVTLLRLIAQVKGVADSIRKAKMAHKIGQYEKKFENEHIPTASSPSSLISEIKEDSDDVNSRNSDGSRKDAACWIYIYKIIETDDHDDQVTVEKLFTSPISHRSTITMAGHVHEPVTSQFEDLRETRLKVVINSGIRKVTLVADVGGLSMRIFLVNLRADVILERQDLLEHVELDSSGKVTQHVSRYSTPTSKVKVNSNLKSVTIDFIEAKTQNSVLKLEVEESSFEAKPNNYHTNVLHLHAIIGATTVSLPLTASKIQSVLNRAQHTIGKQFEDFNYFMSNTSTIDTKATDHTHSHVYDPSEIFIPVSHQTSIATPGRASSEVSRASILPIVFELELKGMNLTTKLLDSITAEYNMGSIIGQGETIPISNRILTAKFNIDHHEIKIDGSFLNNDDKIKQKIDLPPISFDLELRDDNHLVGFVDIEKFQEELTTELFNLLLFLQEELMSEVNDILKQLQNEDRRALFSQSFAQTPGCFPVSNPVLYLFNFTMRGIKVMAKTPTGNMVVFDVPMLEAKVKNHDETQYDEPSAFNYPARKVFVHGKIELKLSLMCQTAKQEEKKLAAFDAVLEGHNTAEQVQDILLVELRQPNIFIHSNAIDRAMIVYLNYRSAYQTWKDEIDLQRSSKTNKNSQTRGLPISQVAKPATLLKPEIPVYSENINSKNNTKLFLKVSVSDFQIKMPLLASSSHDSREALVLVIQSIGVSGTLGDITGFKGLFNGFELCFQSESKRLDQFKLNTCRVKEGELEIISETENIGAVGESVEVAGIWNFLIKWNMQGLDVKLDTKAGVLFSRLGSTLTTLREDTPIPDIEVSKIRYKELDSLYHTQLKTVEDLKSLGATQSIIFAASQQLQEIEKELMQKYVRKRRNGSKMNKNDTAKNEKMESEIELILDASIKINAGTIECYPSAALERLAGNEEERKRISGTKDASVTLFLLPGLHVSLNYQSHGKKSKDLDRTAKLYSNVLIDSMPKEMSISPTFLDYLSETLDTIDEGLITTHTGNSHATSGDVSGNHLVAGFAVDVVVHAMVKPSTVLFSCHPKAKVECTLRVPQMNFVFSSTPATEDSRSGIKLTVQMSDFALRINHPFDKNAKGCLHVNLESIAVNFIREKRKVMMVSVISEIGVAAVNYDMRRLSEILAFPKAWYNRSIARRLFLGEDVGMSQTNANKDTSEYESSAGVWSTSVRVSIMLRELRIEMNIGNVLGKTTWINQELMYHGSFDLTQDNKNDIKSIVKLKKSKLESRSGLLGGHIEMENVEGSCLWQEGKSNDVKDFETGLSELGVRVEYHSSVILLSKLTEPRLVIRDMSDDGDEVRNKEINVTLFLTWNDFAIFMSRSSTPNFIQGTRKISEFIQGQIKSGSEALSSFFDVQKTKDVVTIHDVSADEKYQRHWPPIIQMDKRIKDINLGGSSNMKGKHLTIICFDGRDFKADDWAVFSVNSPNIYFSTDVRQEASNGDKECAIVFQSFSFTIAQNEDLLNQDQDHSLGAFIVHVSKTRHRRRPGAQAGVRDWIAYAVPVIDQYNPEKTKAEDIHVIFAIPQIDIQLKTIQGQELKLPAFPEPQKVECTFSAEFRQELKVTMVPHQIFFLKNFITEYVRENMSVIDTDELTDGIDYEEDIHSSYSDDRDYVCRTWQLQPKLRFLYWNSALEAPGIDLILQRLGFTHARVTIPKWFQRGMLDKLDSTHANLAKKIVQLRFKNKYSEK